VKQGQWEFELETKFCNKKHDEVQTLQEFVLMHRIGRFATDVRREEEGGEGEGLLHSHQGDQHHQSKGLEDQLRTKFDVAIEGNRFLCTGEMETRANRQSWGCLISCRGEVKRERGGEGKGI
jgi:hypothetical protein